MGKYLLIIFIAFISYDAVASDYNKCKQSRDCIVVFSSWCKLPVSINQSYIESWLKFDSIEYTKSKRDRQTCKVYDDRSLYYSYCKDNICNFAVVTRKAD